MCLPPPAPRHALGDFDQGCREQRREQRPDGARVGVPKLHPRYPVEAGEQRDVRVVVQQRHELLHRRKELRALWNVHMEVCLRGEVREPEQHDSEVRPALAAESEKREEGEDARTDAKG
jgi:hypothetical protein